MAKDLARTTGRIATHNMYLEEGETPTAAYASLLAQNTGFLRGNYHQNIHGVPSYYYVSTGVNSPNPIMLDKFICGVSEMATYARYAITLKPLGYSSTDTCVLWINVKDRNYAGGAILSTNITNIPEDGTRWVWCYDQTDYGYFSLNAGWPVAFEVWLIQIISAPDPFGHQTITARNMLYSVSAAPFEQLT